MTDRPHVLLIVLERLSWVAIRDRIATEISTPAIDSLMADGVTFTRAKSTSTDPHAARASLLSGHMPHSEEAADLRHIVSEAGYDWLTIGPGGRAAAPTTGAETPRFWHYTDSGITRIEDWALEHDSLPDLVPPRAPHDYPLLPINHQTAPFEPQAIRAFLLEHPAEYSTEYQTGDPQWWRRYRNAYYRLIEDADSRVARVLASLQESGLYDDTLVVLTSDSGDGHGAHSWMNTFLLYEEASTVPLLIKPPRAAGAMESGVLASVGLDLVPTICDYIGAPAPTGAIGTSLRPAIEGQGDPGDRLVVTEVDYAPGDLPGMQVAKHLGRNLVARTAYSGTYKYTIYDWGWHREQLVDLSSDPGEMINLAMSSRFLSVLNEMREALRDWCTSTEDHFLVRITAGDSVAQY